MDQTRKKMAGCWKRLHAALNVGDSYGNYRCPETAEAGEPSKRRFFAVVRHRPGTKALTRSDARHAGAGLRRPATVPYRDPREAAWVSA
jgi:hypothetical protein